MKINNQSIQDMHLFGDPSHVPVLIEQHVMNVNVPLHGSGNSSSLQVVDQIDSASLPTELGLEEKPVPKLLGLSCKRNGRILKVVVFVHGFQACKLKLKDWKGALSDANSAIREKGNAKAFYRQVMACKALNNTNSAFHGFMSAQDLEPNDGLVKKEIAATVKALSSISFNSVNNKDEMEPETDPKREIEVKSQSHANYEDQMKHELDSEIEHEVIHDVLGGLKYIFRLCAFVTLGGFLFMTGDFKGDTKKWWKMFTLVNSVLFCISVWLSLANTVFKSFGGIIQKRLSVLHIFLPLLVVVIEISLAITIMAWDVPLSHSGAPARSY